MYYICFTFFSSLSFLMFLSLPNRLVHLAMFATYGSPVIVTYMGTNMLTQEEVLGWLPPLVCANCGMLYTD